MPVSIGIRASLVEATSFERSLEAQIILEIRVAGKEVVIDTTLRKLLDGVVDFFPEPVKKRMKQGRVKQLCRKQDQDVMAGLDGGRVQPASGALSGYKSDGRVPGHHRVETKWTAAESFRLKRAELSKIRGECQRLEKPAMVIDFKDKATGRTEDRWVVIPHRDWEKYANAATNNS